MVEGVAVVVGVRVYLFVIRLKSKVGKESSPSATSPNTNPVPGAGQQHHLKNEMIL
jgi:hypothetical protein